jgi:hypothetical protein
MDRGSCLKRRGPGPSSPCVVAGFTGLASPLLARPLAAHRDRTRTRTTLADGRVQDASRRRPRPTRPLPLSASPRTARPGVFIRETCSSLLASHSPSSGQQLSPPMGQDKIWGRFSRPRTFVPTRPRTPTNRDMTHIRCVVISFRGLLDLTGPLARSTGRVRCVLPLPAHQDRISTLDEWPVSHERRTIGAFREWSSVRSSCRL